MSDKWNIIEKQVTGQTQWETARWTTSTGIGEGQLTATQLSPVGALIPNATTDAFDTSGYGGGVTLSYLIRTGTGVQIAFDTNNDVTGLSLINNQLLNSITQQPQVQNAASGNVAFSTSGNGLGGTITLTAATPGGPITGILVTAQGSGYNVGDTLAFSQAQLAVIFGGGTTGSLIVTLQEKDRDIANDSWVQTILQPPTDATVRNFVSSQDAHSAVRLRLASISPSVPNIQQIRLMCAT